MVDAAHVLPQATVDALTARLAAVETATGDQLVVATIPSLGDEPIEDYGYRLGRAWGIGQKGKNTGAILIVAPNDRRVRLEAGYGLEPVLTDAFDEVVIQEKILPAFKAGDIPGGVTAGVEAIAAQLGAAPDAAAAATAQAQAERARPHGHAGIGLGSFFWLAIVIVWLVLSALRRGGGFGGRSSGLGSAILWGTAASMMNRGDDRWGGGGGGFGGGGFGGGGGSFGGGGGFSGGGGSFGGGGASGSW